VSYSCVGKLSPARGVQGAPPWLSVKSGRSATPAVAWDPASAAGPEVTGGQADVESPHRLLSTTRFSSW